MNIGVVGKWSTPPDSNPGLSSSQVRILPAPFFCVSKGISLHKCTASAVGQEDNAARFKPWSFGFAGSNPVRACPIIFFVFVFCRLLFLNLGLWDKESVQRNFSAYFKPTCVTMAATSKTRCYLTAAHFSSPTS